MKFRLLFLWLQWKFWAHRHAQAARFRSQLENIIAQDRRSAQYDADYTELRMHRAEIELIACRADARMETLR